MKAQLIYIIEEHVGNYYYSPHAFIGGKDIGEVHNLPCHDETDGLPEDNETEIEVEEHQVCPECFDESEKDDCTCWYNKYKTIKVIKAVCKCCGHTL